MASEAPAGCLIAAHVLQFHFEQRAVDGALGPRIHVIRQRGGILGPRAFEIAFRNLSIAADLANLRGERAGLLGIQQAQRLVMLALLNEQTSDTQPRDPREFRIGDSSATARSSGNASSYLPSSTLLFASNSRPCCVYGDFL